MNLTLIQVYAPTSDADEEEREEVYNCIEELLEHTPRKDAVIVMGNFNPKIGHQAVEEVCRNFRLGKRNEAGDQLAQFCIEHKFTIMNTCFEQHKRCLYTWTSPNRFHQNQIDYILC